MDIKIILPAYDIPDGSTVTKITGTYQYILSKTIRIFGELKQEIKQQNIVFLTKPDNPINFISAIADYTSLIWVTTEEELYEYLQEKLDII